MSGRRFAKVLFAFALLSLTLYGIATAGTGEFASFNVRDFGAKGDGKTDDTKAIQAALDAAGKKGWSEQYPGSAYYVSSPVVFFPSGKYIISDTLQIRANMAGEGTAIIYQKKRDKDILSGTYVWRWQISGFTFVGGRNHLNIGNPNIDTGRIIIEKCAFYKAAEAAIRTRKGSNSTQISIRDCVFIHNDQVFINWCDMGSITDSWISTSKEMKNKAVIENHGSLMLENICGVPAVARENDQRWIDNYGSVTARNFRFGGEGAGFTAVVNFAPYDYTYPVNPSSVILDSCTVYSIGNPKRRAAIYLEQIPNQIIVRDSTGFCDIPVVKVSEKINLDTYFDNAEKRRASLRFYIDRDNVEVMDYNWELPEEMRPYQVNPIVAESKPKTGHWQRGTFIWNRNPEGHRTAKGFQKTKRRAEIEPIGWYCVKSGKPGIWLDVYGNFNRPFLPRITK